jgi:hypothetical protein
MVALATVLCVAVQVHAGAVTVGLSTGAFVRADTPRAYLVCAARSAAPAAVFGRALEIHAGAAALGQVVGAEAVALVAGLSRTACVAALAAVREVTIERHAFPGALDLPRGALVGTRCAAGRRVPARHREARNDEPSEKTSYELQTTGKHEHTSGVGAQHHTAKKRPRVRFIALPGTEGVSHSRTFTPARPLRRRTPLPRLKVRVINVVDQLRPQDAAEHTHGLSAREFDGLFATDRAPVSRASVSCRGWSTRSRVCVARWTTAGSTASR